VSNKSGRREKREESRQNNSLDLHQGWKCSEFLCQARAKSGYNKWSIPTFSIISSAVYIEGISMGNKPISTRPVSDEENLLRKKFYESIAAQSDLMDKMSGQLLTLELAIPGLFATVLKLTGGDDATAVLNTFFYLAFGCWLLALLFTLLALIPKKWNVDPDLLQQDPASYSEGLGIRDFFEQSAHYKRRLVIASSILFFSGIFFAAFTIG
jgi:hypothetical protein